MQFLVPGCVLTALDLLKSAGYAAYLVGGCVRDDVLGIPPHDYDLCTAATPEQIEAVFSAYRTLNIGKKHGTITVLIDNEPLEITTFRVDGAYADGRHPDQVRFTTRVAEDLSRRDFTINAMAWNPDEGLVDPFHGQDDCENQVIRAVGQPSQRFDEDALRILRGLRFAARLGFAIEGSTANAIHTQKGLLQRISRERIAAELTGILLGSAAADILLQYRDVLFAAVPQLAPMGNCPQRSIYHIYDVWRHTAETVRTAPQTPLLRWAALLHDCAKPQTRTRDSKGLDHFYGHPIKGATLAKEILLSLKMPTAFIRQVEELVLWHDEPIKVPDVHYWLTRLSDEAFDNLLALKRADTLAHAPFVRKQTALLKSLAAEKQRVLDEGLCRSLVMLAVTGDELFTLGYRGASIGQALQALLTAVTRGVLPNQKDALLQAAHHKMEGN